MGAQARAVVAIKTFSTVRGSGRPALTIPDLTIMLGAGHPLPRMVLNPSSYSVFIFNVRTRNAYRSADSSMILEVGFPAP